MATEPSDSDRAEEIEKRWGAAEELCDQVTQMIRASALSVTEKVDMLVELNRVVWHAGIGIRSMITGDFERYAVQEAAYEGMRREFFGRFGDDN